MHLCFYLLKSLVACAISQVKGVINLIQDQLNVYFLGILALRRDTNVTHLLFVIVTLMLMSRSMNLNPISLIRWVVTVLPCLPRLLLVSPTEPPQKPLQVYRRRQKAPTKTSSPRSDPPPKPNSLPISLRKDKRTCTSHFISLFVSYYHLSSSINAFTLSLNSAIIHKFVQEAMSMIGSLQ